MTAAAPRRLSFDGPLGRQIVDLYVWAVRQGLLGAAAEELFAGFCQRLIEAGVPLWRGYAAMRTLHPQWGGYGYSWRRELNAIEAQQFGRGIGRTGCRARLPICYSRQRQRLTMESPGCICAGI